jgi:tetratricopeptide (TPR) repeat protein
MARSIRALAAVTLCLSLTLHAGAPLARELDAAVLGRAEALVRAGRAEQAWQLLAPLERQHAGRSEFDYLLGVAALESGRANRATFILERVITANPGHLAARLEMARAYFELRDYERAEREFTFILGAAPSAEVRAMSQLYLARIREVVQPASAGTFSGYAEVAVGRDTNVAAASSQSSVFIPGLGTDLVTDPMFQRQPDNFTAIGAGLEYYNAPRANLGVLAGVEVRQRWYSELDTFDSRSADFQAALVHRLDERNRMQYSARYNYYELDNSPYRETPSLGVQWTRRTSLQTRFALGAEAHRIRYQTEATKANSSDLTAGSAGVTHVLHPATLTTVGGLLYFGYDRAVAGRPDGDRRILGASLGVQRRFFERAEAYLRFAVADSDYLAVNPDFGVTRRDRQLDAALGLDWEFARGWLLRPQVARTSNRSNIPLDEYDRTETSLTLRRVWD